MTDPDTVPTDPERLRAEVLALREENTLLLLQMHRLYGELDPTLVPQSAASPAGSPDAAAEAALLDHLCAEWQTRQGQEVEIDLRGPVPGEGWHAAESDGRWAGPGTESTLRLPALKPGLYSVQFEIVDAMAPDILHGLELRCDGQPLAAELLYDGYPALLLGQFELFGDARSRTVLALRSPRAMAPRERGEDDDRRLTVRVRRIACTWLEPR